MVWVPFGSLEERAASHARAVVATLEPRLDAGTLLSLTKEEQSFMAILNLSGQEPWLGPTLLVVVATNQIQFLKRGGAPQVSSTTHSLHVGPRFLLDFRRYANTT
jgi:hypothetical protein